MSWEGDRVEEVFDVLDNHRIFYDLFVLVHVAVKVFVSLWGDSFVLVNSTFGSFEHTSTFVRVSRSSWVWASNISIVSFCYATDIRNIVRRGPRSLWPTFAIGGFTLTFDKLLFQ